VAEHNARSDRGFDLALRTADDRGTAAGSTAAAETDRDGGWFLYRVEGARARFVARHDDIGKNV
jgi:hypothetical protein